MVKKIVFISLLALLTVGPALLGQCDSETVYITAYYPAPDGIYNEVRLYPHNPPITACSPLHFGMMYYDSVIDKLQICDNLGSESAGAPTHTITFFNRATCPPGWHEFVQARGRYAVAIPLGGTLGIAVGTPLSDQENRPAGYHTHNEVGVTASASNRGPGGLGDTLWLTPMQTSGPIEGSSVDGTNAPYIQLCACEKD